MAVTRIKNNQVTDSTIVASAKLQAGSVTGTLLSDPLNYLGDFTITGNLTVNGTTTTVDTTNTLVADPVIVLSRGETGSPSNDSGFLVERGTSSNVAWLWDEQNDRFMAIYTASDGLSGGAVTPTGYADVKVGNIITDGGISLGNINISGNTISSINSNGNINITPNGSGEVVAATIAVTDLTEGRVVYVGANDALVDNANLTFDGTNLTVTGTSNVSGQFNADNLRVDGNTISSTNANGNIVLDPDGTGNVIVDTATSDRLFYSGANKELITDANLTFDGSNLTVTGTSNVSGQFNADNLRVDGNTISSTNANGNIILDPDGSGNVIVDTATATRVFYAGANKELITDANLTFDGTNLTVGGNLSVNGGDINTTALTANIFNSTATTVNVGGAATTLNLGSGAGEVVIVNDLKVSGNSIKSSTGQTAIDLNGEDVTIIGNLTVQGQTTTVGTNDLIVEDSLIQLHVLPNLAPLTADDGRDIGFIFHYYKTEDAQAGLVWANDTGALEYYSDAIESNAGTFTGSYGTIKANIFWSAVTTGTAPLTINSTTEVANLNAKFANVVTNPNQSNITSLGILTSLTVDNLNLNDNTLTSVNTNGNIILDPNGTGNVIIDSATANRIFYSGENKELITTSNLTFNGSILELTGTANIAGQLNVDNIRIDGTTISTSANNDNINLTPNGSGKVIASTLAVTDLTEGRVVYVGANDALVDNANLTFDGTNLTVTGTVNVSGQFNADNLRVDGNTISSTNSNGNINIDANGTGYVIVNSSGDDSDFIVNGNVTAGFANLIYVKSITGQIGIGTNTPGTDVTLDVSSFTNSVILTKGATIDRPGTPIEGMFRYNTSLHTYEFHDGTEWVLVAGNYTQIVSDTFSGDGSSTQFILSQDSNSASLIISINGVVQKPGTAYGVSGTTLTFTEAPQLGDEIDVRILTTTATVTAITDLNTEITVNDLAERANVKIDGDIILSVSNLALLPGADDSYNIGSSSARWKNVYATNTSIQNADLAENYLADQLIEPGTVVSFGGSEEVTISSTDMDTRVAGVVSTAPAHIMNSALEGSTVIPLALQGRVPVKVTGSVRKGDMMVSAGNGHARAEENPKLGSVIGKALQDFDGQSGIIEVVVGRL